MGALDAWAGWKPVPRVRQHQVLNKVGNHKSLPANNRVMGFQPMSYASNSKMPG